MKLLYLLKRPSALIPVAMSVAALGIVIGYAAMFGTARQADEGTAAHVWRRGARRDVPGLVVPVVIRVAASRWYWP